MDRLIRAKFRVKIKSLADEARTIRVEERTACEHGAYATCNGLHEHRVGVVRPEARAALLAYAFCRGVPYGAVEAAGTRKEIDLKRVVGICRSLADRLVSPAEVMDWVARSVAPAAA